ncbi:PREDICTED: charged multivesicular body protein 4c-like [Diuraphis noxia]|uniref:charged multivesicular body protein 4c-like n=1 Tax=Diuraphis noxia TaxID=143948 RepID=UPI000763B4C5|nr:PREDICTED: charged multivesicular body protein 4c-like [Diuraphis noxia]
MNFFRKVFGCKEKDIKRPSPSTEIIDALQKLQSTEQLLREKREVLEKNIKKEQATVKKNVIKNKQVALNALNRKKCYEQQLSRNDSMLSTVIKQQSSLDIANTKDIVVDVLSSTSSAVKKAKQNVNIDGIHNMIDDIITSQEFSQEISEAICNPTRLETDEDEEKLQKELENLKLANDEQVMNIDPLLTTNYPMLAVPTFVSNGQKKKNITRQKNSMMT